MSFPIYTWQEKSRTVEVGSWQSFLLLLTIPVLLIYECVLSFHLFHWCNPPLIDRLKRMKSRKKVKRQQRLVFLNGLLVFLMFVESCFFCNWLGILWHIGWEKEEEEDCYWEILGLGTSQWNKTHMGKSGVTIACSYLEQHPSGTCDHFGLQGSKG